MNNQADFSQYGIGAKFILGGNLPSPQKNTVPFSGLKTSEVLSNQIIKLNLAWQYNFQNNLYFTPHFEAASLGYGNFRDFIGKALSPNTRWDNLSDTGFLTSFGTTFSYNSIIGPIDLDFSWINNINKLRVFLGVGFALP